MAGAGTKLFTDGSILTAAQVNTYLQDQVIMRFANAATRDAAFGGVGEPLLAEGMFCYLDDVDQMQVYNGSAWIVFGTSATTVYQYVQTLYYTSAQTFTKASYPWLRAIRVKCQAGGGGGAGAAPLSAGSGGAGGGYAESFITNIAGLAASISISVGAGGAAGGAGDLGGGSGGTSSFGALVSASGGGGGLNTTGETGGSSGAGTAGDLLLYGTSGGKSSGRLSGAGGASILGGGGGSAFKINSGQRAGQAGGNYGGGASGGSSVDANVAGAAGAQGIVIVELYA